MTITIQVNRTDDELVIDHEIVLDGICTAVADHSIEVTLRAGERDKLGVDIANGKKQNRRSVRRPLRFVDADRLIAWQLYWRGENFWSGGEIWRSIPELKTSFPSTTSNVEFQKYISDRSRVLRSPGGVLP